MFRRKLSQVGSLINEALIEIFEGFLRFLFYILMSIMFLIGFIYFSCVWGFILTLICSLPLFFLFWFFVMTDSKDE
jgi:hypothetical protein